VVFSHRGWRWFSDSGGYRESLVCSLSSHDAWSEDARGRAERALCEIEHYIEYHCSDAELAVAERVAAAE
jgi:hypothetical protein